MKDFIFYLLAAIGGIVVYWIAWSKAWDLISAARKEAAEHNKRVEFGAFIIGVIGLLIAVVSLAYSVIKIDAAEERAAQLHERLLKLEVRLPQQ